MRSSVGSAFDSAAASQPSRSGQACSRISRSSGPKNVVLDEVLLAGALDARELLGRRRRARGGALEAVVRGVHACAGLGQRERVLALDLHPDRPEVEVLAHGTEVDVALAHARGRGCQAALGLVLSAVDGVRQGEGLFVAGLDDRCHEIDGLPFASQVGRRAVDLEAARDAGQPHAVLDDEGAPGSHAEGTFVVAVPEPRIDRDRDRCPRPGRPCSGSRRAGPAARWRLPWATPSGPWRSVPAGWRRGRGRPLTTWVVPRVHAVVRSSVVRNVPPARGAASGPSATPTRTRHPSSVRDVGRPRGPTG